MILLLYVYLRYLDGQLLSQRLQYNQIRTQISFLFVLLAGDKIADYTNINTVKRYYSYISIL